MLKNFIPKREQYMDEVAQGHVNLVRHPENPDVILLNYTPELVYSRKWNEVNIQCRGLIINEATGEVLAKPFPKFFNYRENPMFDAMIPQGQIPHITVKQDGSLGIMYRLNGEIRWATRGSFTSMQSQIAQRIWDEKYKDNNKKLVDGIWSHLTLMCEIIHPDTRVVVPYNFSDLVLIGATSITRNAFDDDLSHEALVGLGYYFDMPVTESLDGHDIESILEKAKTLTYQEEGFVLRWNTPNGVLRLKVKGDEYMKVHRVLYSLSKRQIVDCWLEGKIDELIRAVPEEFRNEIEQTKMKLDSVSKFFKTSAEYIWSFKLSDDCKSRKDFASYVMSNTDSIEGKYIRGLAFKMYDEKPIVEESRVASTKWFLEQLKEAKENV